MVTFQSRFGKAEWLTPYTSDTLAALGRDGVGRVDVICPGFVYTPLVARQIPEQAEQFGITEDEVVKKIMLKDTVDGEFTTVQDVAEVINHALNPGATSVVPAATPNSSWGKPDEQVPGS